MSTSCNGTAISTESKAAPPSAPAAVAVSPNGYVLPTELLKSAPPPLHAVAVLGFFLSAFAYHLPSLDSVDEVATAETFTKILFPEYVTSVRMLGWIRIAIAASIFATSFHLVAISDGWQQQTTYQKGSKLKMTPNTLRGIKTMMPFTSWSWNFLGAAVADCRGPSL